MKTENQYDPHSLTAKVKERLEKRARGTLTGESHSNLAAHKATDSLPKTGTFQFEESVSDQFMGLLLGTPHTENRHVKKEQEKHAEKFNFHGTKASSLSLNLQEEEKQISGGSKEGFSFSINNLPEGKVQVNGTYVQGKLEVTLNLAQNLSVKEQDALAKILGSRLSVELGVPLEVKIGRNNR